MVAATSLVQPTGRLRNWSRTRSLAGMWFSAVKARQPAGLSETHEHSSQREAVGARRVEAVGEVVGASSPDKLAEPLTASSATGRPASIIRRGERGAAASKRLAT